MKYQEIPVMSKAEIEAAILEDNPDELLFSVLSAALYADDRKWAESICIKLSEHQHFNVRGNAILAFGYIARKHGALEKKMVEPLIEKALQDPNKWVRGQTENAADDVEMYLGWKIKREK